MRAPALFLVTAVLLALPLAAGGAELYLTNTHSGTISIIDTYATLRKANTITVIRTQDLEVAARIPQPGYPDLVTMAPDGTKAYATNRHANVVSVIGLADHREVKRIPVGKGPHGMALLPAARP